MCAQTLKCKNCEQSFYGALIPPVSPDPSLLASNTIPSNAETANTRSALLEADCTCDLLKINTDIDVPETLLEQRNRQEGQMLEDFCNSESGLLSPVRSLPPELLSEVFLNVFASDGPQGILFRAFALSTVCSYWRNVALSTPGLWCQIYANIDEGDPDSIADMVQTWIERSGQYPLSISLESHHKENSPQSVIDMIVNHSHQLRLFDVSLRPSVFQLLAPLKSRLPMLQTLRLHVHTSPGHLRHPCDVFEDVPRLRVLDTSCPPGMFVLPLKQIVQCSLLDLGIDNCLEILHRSPNVNTCTFTRTDGFFHFHSPVVSHVKSLSITEFLDDAFKFGFQLLLTSLTLPSLREIFIENSKGYHWPQAGFMGLLSRSSCQLRKLVLSRARISNRDLVSCLEATPTLEELEIGDMATPSDADHTYAHPINDTVLQALSHRAGWSSQRTLLPSLHSLRIWGDSKFCHSIFLKMIESRWLGTLPTGLTRLQRVDVDLTIYDMLWDFMPQTWDRVEELRNQGLDIRLSSTVRRKYAVHRKYY
jgi:hypothetical protein